MLRLQIACHGGGVYLIRRQVWRINLALPSSRCREVRTGTSVRRWLLRGAAQGVGLGERDFGWKWSQATVWSIEQGERTLNKGLRMG